MKMLFAVFVFVFAIKGILCAFRGNSTMCFQRQLHGYYCKTAFLDAVPSDAFTCDVVKAMLNECAFQKMVDSTCFVGRHEAKKSFKGRVKAEAALKFPDALRKCPEYFSSPKLAIIENCSAEQEFASRTRSLFCADSYADFSSKRRRQSCASLNEAAVGCVDSEACFPMGTKRRSDFELELAVHFLKAVREPLENCETFLADRGVTAVPDVADVALYERRKVRSALRHIHNAQNSSSATFAIDHGFKFLEGFVPKNSPFSPEESEKFLQSIKG